MNVAAPADPAPSEQVAPSEQAAPAPEQAGPAPEQTAAEQTARELEQLTPSPDPDTCALCGTRLDPDQEWCLECGVARTVIHSPPDWRAPAAVIAAVAIVALVAFAIALVNLGDPAPTTTVTVTTPAPGHPSAAASGGTRAAAAATLGSWPPGLSGWTVVLASTPDRAAAIAEADRLSAAGLRRVGVLDTSEHPRLRPGHFYVFVDRYPAQAAAEAAATALATHGHPGGVVREIAPPGGI